MVMDYGVEVPSYRRVDSKKQTKKLDFENGLIGLLVVLASGVMISRVGFGFVEGLYLAPFGIGYFLSMVKKSDFKKLLLVYLAVILACMIFDDKCNIERSAYVFTMGVLVCSGLHALLVLRVAYGWEYLLLLAIATFGSDTGAYFAGMAFGKHKLIPRLSPKKTIEGSIGGIVLGSVLGLVFAYFTGILAHHWIIVPAIIVMTTTSQIGDLIFSAIKRYFEVKDYSKLLPGHGGILDRIDSLTFNVLIFSFFLMIVGL